jgi:hypothetical protein
MKMIVNGENFASRKSLAKRLKDFPSTGLVCIDHAPIGDSTIDFKGENIIKTLEIFAIVFMESRPLLDVYFDEQGCGDYITMTYEMFSKHYGPSFQAWVNP